MKNKFLKLASGLLVLCLVTTCAIGATFAKYTTGDKASDTARVAKWGVEVSTSGTLFGEAYGANDVIVAKDNTVATVLSSGIVNNIGNVVAPGTKNETGFQVKLAGQPEVDFTVVVTDNDVAAKEVVLKGGNTYGVMVEAHGITATNFVADTYYTANTEKTTYTLAATYTDTTYYKLMDKVVVGTDYYPIAWTVTEEGDTKTDVSATRLADIYTEIAGYLNGDYGANVKVDQAYTLTWAWVFGTNDVANEDTILGNIAAGVEVVKLSGANYVDVETTDYCLEVAFGIKVTATQVD